MEIILLRHGKPIGDLKGNFNACELKQLVVSYAQSSIQDHPDEELKGNYDSHYVVCSDLKRSIQSAKKLGLENIHYSDALFAETNIPHFDKGFIKLPIIIWLISLRLMWLFGFKNNGESFIQAKKRAERATDKLIVLAQENEKVILVGHGLMNRLIAKQLRLKNWQGPPSPGKKYWEFGEYRK